MTSLRRIYAGIYPTVISVVPLAHSFRHVAFLYLSIIMSLAVYAV